MSEYLIIYGPMGISAEKATPVSVRSEGNSMTVTGPKKDVEYWSAVLGSSVVLAASYRNGQPSFRTWASANSMLDTLVFDEDEWDTHSSKFDAIKGSRKTTPLYQIPTDKFGMYSGADQRKFQKRVKPLMDAITEMNSQNTYNHS